MPHLTLIRHAKSSWDRVDLSDHLRTLNERGYRTAPAIGRWLATEGWARATPGPPDLWRSSTATRARITAHIIAGECAVDPASVEFDPDLYLATDQNLLRLVRSLPVHCKHVVLFGHNPGLEDLANLLLARDTVSPFKTAGVACLDLPSSSWSDIQPSSASLVFHQWPASLEDRS